MDFKGIRKTSEALGHASNAWTVAGWFGWHPGLQTFGAGIVGWAVTFFGGAVEGLSVTAVWTYSLMAGAGVAAAYNQVAQFVIRRAERRRPQGAGGPSTSHALDSTLKLESLHEIFQFPSDGKLLELVVHSLEPPVASFQRHWMSEHAYRESPHIIPTRHGMLDRCRLTNFGAAPVFNVQIVAQIHFSEHIPRENNVTEVRQIAVRDFAFSVPQVEGGGFADFYLWNTTPYVVSVMMPGQIELQVLGSNERETVRLIPAFAMVGLWPPESATAPRERRD